MRGHRWSVAAGVAAVVVLGGCSDDGEGEAGFGVPRTPADAVVPGEGIRGTVRVEDNGCLTLETDSGERRWIIWPADQEDDQGQPVLGGRLVADGDVLVGSGAELPGDALPDWARQQGYFSSFGGFCSADDTGVVVLEDVDRE